MDALFTIAADGVDGVNIHTFPDAANGLWDFDHANGQWQATVHPIYYGLEMFAQAAPAGSRLLRVYSGPQSQFRAWATRGPDHRTRVLLINDSLRQSTVAEVRVPSAPRTAQIERLRGPSAYATGGISIGDKSFGASTSTGLLPAPRPQAVVARSGVYAVGVPPSSAALITMP
jgi:hypothetical protein